MSKNKKIKDFNKIIKNSIYTPITPRIKKQKIELVTDFRKNSKYSSEYYNTENSPSKNAEASIANYNLEINNSPTDLLSILLKNILGKSLTKLESNTKEQMTTLKSIYKNFMVFDKNINLLKTGVEKKKKENEKKLLAAKKLKNSRTAKTPFRIRSKTYQNFRNPRREDSINEIKTFRNRKNTSKLKTKNNKNNFKNIFNNKNQTYRSTQYSNIYGPKSKTSRENFNYPQKITKMPKTPKRIEQKENQNYKTFKRLSGVFSKNNNNFNKEKRNSIKKIYNTTNTSINMNSTARTFKKKKSIKLNERPLERRKSIKGIKKYERNIKKKMSIKSKNKIKIDGNTKIRKSISNVINTNEEKVETPVLKDIEKNISNFNFNDINIINNNINILNNDNLQKSIINLKENNDINLITNENININEIINEKNSEIKNDNDNESENKKENHNIKTKIKVLEDLNEKKPKYLEDKKKLYIKRRMRSYSKNRDKKIFDSISIDKDFEGSLNDVKLMIEGVSGVLKKINVTNVKSKFRKKLINDDSFSKEINSEKKDKKSRDKSKSKNKEININEKCEDKNKLLNEIDKEIMELIEAEEKRKELKKEKNKEKVNEVNIIENIENDNNLNIKNKDNENNNFQYNVIIEEENSNINNEKIEKKIIEVKNDNDIIIEEINNNDNYDDNDDIIPKINNNNKNDEDKYNLSLIRNLKYEEEKLIMNEDIIKKINSENHILTNDLNINNKASIDIEKNDNENIKHEDDNNSIEEKNQINEEIQINKNINNITFKDIIPNNERKIIKKRNSYLNTIDRNKLFNLDAQNDLIQNESRIMHDEQLVDVNNQSLNQSSMINQSSMLNLSLLERYIFIAKEPNIPFSIENTLKYDKIKCLGILDFLNFQEKMEFTGIHRGFNIERISFLNNKREDFIKILELSNRETINDLIMKIRLNYTNDELSKNFTKFEISRGPSKAVELLNNELYSKIFKKNYIEKNEEEICKVYRVLFVLFDEYEIANINNNRLFWTKCVEYLTKNSDGKIGSFILDKINNISFEHKKIFLINKILLGMKKIMIPNYFSKICGTTGLLVFGIKDALEYCGVIKNDKKTQPSRILDNLLYYKNSIDTIASFIDYLSGIKTYKIKDKKDIK